MTKVAKELPKDLPLSVPLWTKDSFFSPVDGPSGKVLPRDLDCVWYLNVTRMDWTSFPVTFMLRAVNSNLASGVGGARIILKTSSDPGPAIEEAHAQ